MATRKTTTAKAETEINVPVKEKPQKRTFANDEMIPCRSITSGELLMVGGKTETLYRWADYGDVCEIEYQDLLYDTRTAKSNFVLFPRFIILDDDFISQNKKVEALYNQFYTQRDLSDILIEIPAGNLKDAILELPEGVRKNLRNVASTMILNGTLDSVRKIKVLDEIFDTQLLLTLAES